MVDLEIIYLIKTDLIDHYFFIPQKYYPSITISAKEDININRLIKLITDNLFSEYQKCTLHVPYNELSLLEDIKRNSIEFEITYDEVGAIFNGKVGNKVSKLIDKYKIKK